jgi:hypothetical protein
MSGLDLLCYDVLSLLAWQRIKMGEYEILIILVDIEVFPDLEEVLLEREERTLGVSRLH